MKKIIYRPVYFYHKADHGLRYRRDGYGVLEFFVDGRWVESLVNSMGEDTINAFTKNILEFEKLGPPSKSPVVRRGSF